MDKIKHTPGPWIWGDEYRGLFGAGPNNEVLSHEYFEGMWLSHVEHRDANAKLISAAPDLAMALELIAADADAGNSRLTSGVRMALDAALIQAGRKKAPEPVRHITITGVDR
ncbi:hypothetical protein [Burkholderia sp. LMG 13014]|uniref:hypothetical protein n=1 Tax=Burkholderia sp. LMG 13014 TaxID=2709306 RepID=UPI0019661B6E|nr:hypothetical protein [Burkholderia sp. LMG 13014]